MGKIWDSPKFQAVVASVITSAFWIILLSPAVLLDLAYYEIIHYKPFLKILGIIRIASNFGIHYTAAFSVLSQSSGMLISIIGFFLTLSIGTNERAEKKVYGIYRRELTNNKRLPSYIQIHRMNFLSPLLMILLLNLRYCISAYWLLFWTYFFLMAQYYIYVSSFSALKDRQAVLRKIKQTLASDVNRQTLFRYRLLLEDIGSSIWETNDWDNAEYMINELNGEKKLPPYFCYLFSHYFFEDIVCRKDIKDDLKAVHIFLAQMEESDSRILQDGELQEREQFLLWGLMTAVAERWKEAEVLSILDNFLNFAARSKRAMERNETESDAYIPLAVFREQSVIVEICLELWMRKNTVSSNDMVEQAKMLHKYRNAVSRDDRDNIMNLILSLPESVIDTTIDDCVKCYQELEFDAVHKSRKCRISCIIDL